MCLNEYNQYRLIVDKYKEQRKKLYNVPVALQDRSKTIYSSRKYVINEEETTGYALSDSSPRDLTFRV